MEKENISSSAELVETNAGQGNARYLGSNPTAAKVHFFPSDNRKEKENISSRWELEERNAGHAIWMDGNS